ncbi:MAG: ATP-binding protein [Gemmatimonadota bacterium]|nr:ATP-binding protein [Gemmatimonadota bacterium]MDQ8168090.1 ATP-binding protein [Gemmatimonadota bacterium]MDQ8173152.1 ATP-binding protein [Gemmatimonadota bacterium]
MPIDEQPPFARRLLDALPLTVWAVDLEGRITAANSAWSRFATDNGAPGIAREAAVLGRSVFEHVADDASREQIERAMTLLRERRVPVVRWEFPCNSPSEERVFLMQVTAIDDGTTISGFVFSTVDITPSHRSREALINTGIALAEAISLDRVYEEVALQLRRAVPSTGFVITLADDDTAEFRITHRQGYGAHTNAELEARLLRTWLDALASGHVVRQSTDIGLEITAPLITAEGVLGAITLYAEPIESEQALEEAERVLAVIAAQTAVAIERAWLVERVEQKRRLEAIGEVAAGVAHELRNPLFGISSAAQLLQFRAKDDPVVERNVGRILREVERLSQMVTSLLEFGRPNAVHLTPADPETVWDDILEGERARLETKLLTIRRHRPELAVRSLIDVQQLGQVCRNILANACDAAPDGSELILHTQISPAGGWRCRLTNGGPVIPADVLPHVFEFFYSNKTGGTGIGLALCQRIMDEHGGTISIDSTHEWGTTLTLTLPPPIAT